MNVQDFDYVPITVAGEDAWLRVTLDTGCNVQPGMANSTDILHSFPDTPAGFQLKTRDCGSSADVFAVADNVDRSGTTPTDPGDNPGASNPDAELNTQTFISISGADGGQS